MSVSIQRWVYAQGETVPEALRNLADEMGREVVPTDEQPKTPATEHPWRKTILGHTVREIPCKPAP